MTAIKTLAAQEGLAKSFASFCPATPEALKNEFEKLNSSAQEAALVPITTNQGTTESTGVSNVL